MSMYPGLWAPGATTMVRSTPVGDHKATRRVLVMVSPLCDEDLTFRRVLHSTFTFRAFSRRFLPKVTYNKYICQKTEKQQNISVGTVRMFIEPSAKH
jgi:hypothetical protein